MENSKMFIRADKIGSHLATITALIRLPISWLADAITITARDKWSSWHMVASVYVICDNKVLLIHHRKLNRWLAPGGHLKFRETPDDCAIRETFEETGVTATIIDGQHELRNYPEAGVRLLPRPLTVQLEQI